MQLRLPDGSLFSQGGANPYIIGDNPILSVNPEKVWLENIRQALAEVAYTPCKVSFPQDPDISAGSILHLQDTQGKQITAYVMEKVSKGQRDSVSCTGSMRRDSAAAHYSQTPSQKSAAAAAQTVASITRQDIVDRLTDHGKIRGITAVEDQWHIDAAVAVIANLVAERLLSRKENAALEISEAALHLLQENAAILTLCALDGQPALTLQGETRNLAWRDNGDGTCTLIGIQGGTNESDP